MTEIRQLLGLMRPWTGWILLGVLISLITSLANITLMSISGWFISAMALAGLAVRVDELFHPRSCHPRHGDHPHRRPLTPNG